MASQVKENKATTEIYKVKILTVLLNFKLFPAAMCSGGLSSDDYSPLLYKSCQILRFDKVLLYLVVQYVHTHFIKLAHMRAEET